MIKLSTTVRLNSNDKDESLSLDEIREGIYSNRKDTLKNLFKLYRLEKDGVHYAFTKFNSSDKILSIPLTLKLQEYDNFLKVYNSLGNDFTGIAYNLGKHPALVSGTFVDDDTKEFRLSIDSMTEHGFDISFDIQQSHFGKLISSVLGTVGYKALKVLFSSLDDFNIVSDLSFLSRRDFYKSREGIILY